MKSLMVAPKERDNITQKSGVIYRYKCNRLEWGKEFIGESARPFEEEAKRASLGPFPHL